MAASADVTKRMQDLMKRRMAAEDAAAPVALSARKPNAESVPDPNLTLMAHRSEGHGSGRALRSEPPTSLRTAGLHEPKPAPEASLKTPEGLSADLARRQAERMKHPFFAGSDAKSEQVLLPPEPSRSFGNRFADFASNHIKEIMGVTIPTIITGQVGAWLATTYALSHYAKAKEENPIEAHLMAQFGIGVWPTVGHAAVPVAIAVASVALVKAAPERLKYAMKTYVATADIIFAVGFAADFLRDLNALGGFH